MAVTAPTALQSPRTPQAIFQMHPFEDDLFLAYMRHRLLHGRAQQTLYLKAPDKQLAAKCLLALSTTYFGAEHGDFDLVQRGQHQYNEALSDLNMALSNPSQCRTYDVLESVVVMTIFEFMASTSEHGWIHHACGLEKLMALQGPDSFKSLAALTILEQSQAIIILAALVLHRSTIFSKDEWKYAPWENHPDRRSDVQDLYDILADCAELQVAKDKAHADLMHGKNCDMHQTVIENVNSLLKQLSQWRCNWTYEEVPVTKAAPNELNAKSDIVPVWNTSYCFNSLHGANGHGLSNAILILLLRMQRETMAAADITCPQASDMTKTIYDAGIAICRSVDYHLDHSRVGSGSLILQFPLRMAYEAVAVQSPSVARWIRDVLQDINVGSAGRWSSAKHLLQVGFRNLSTL
ncbi:fungal-specific transcription factor domain-containing protein [Truncatella angustata]|uniref:Fungal-specific transcription factor domain-containing protein n=1 Tax=Truncatella angustata TaxID=152316 RepID=A0A9P8RKT5_9PEZI|nr:fungal-specific transcription factor domain-containing protein [Truncatella angustata]KAH6647890.1 fungal-specific transcription factor domain-containing protein [Truncatella angustata]